MEPFLSVRVTRRFFVSQATSRPSRSNNNPFDEFSRKTRVLPSGPRRLMCLPSVKYSEPSFQAGPSVAPIAPWSLGLDPAAIGEGMDEQEARIRIGRRRRIMGRLLEIGRPNCDGRQGRTCTPLLINCGALSTGSVPPFEAVTASSFSKRLSFRALVFSYDCSQDIYNNRRGPPATGRANNLLPIEPGANVP